MIDDYEEIDDKIMRRLKSDRGFFAEKMLGIVLHWYQEEVINDPYKYKAMCWSRQIGKSTMVAVYVVWWIFTHQGTPDNKKKILIISQDRDASRRFYNMVISMIRNNKILRNEIDGESLQTRTEFKNYVVMFNKAPGRTGRSIRGDSIDLLVIDEADFIEEEVFVSAEQTTASTEGEIILISTPNKKGSTFHQYFKDGMEAKKKNSGEMPLNGDETEEELEYIRRGIGYKYFFKSYHYDYTVGRNVYNKKTGKPQLSKIVVNRMKRKRAKWQFQQEYEAIWAEDVASYFSEQDIMNAVDENYDMQYHGKRGHKYYLGVDFAKHVDRTVVLVGRLNRDGILRIVYIYEMEGRNWVEQVNEIMKIAKRFYIEKAFLDGTGVGDSMFDNLNGMKSPLSGRCERIVFTTPTKNSIYQNLNTLLMSNLIRIPHHKQLIDEMIYLQYEKLENSDYVRIRAPKGMHNINDDFPDALALLSQCTDAPDYSDIAMKQVSHMRHANMYPNYWESDKPNDDLPFWNSIPGARKVKNDTFNIADKYNSLVRRKRRRRNKLKRRARNLRF